jgi:hypothetical protein
MENIPAIARKIIGNLLSVKESPIMQRTVKEFIWGYQDPLLNELKSNFPFLVTDDQISVFASVVTIQLCVIFHGEHILILGQRSAI